jgi:hypothetical protein
MNVSKSPYDTYMPPSWWKRNAVEILIFFVGITTINLIFIAKAYRETNTVNPETAGQLGSFVGGYIGTTFALVSVLLLFKTLKNQREASSIEKFETKYFELVRLHRENVDELSIGKDKGRKVFVLLIREFRSILEIVKQIALKHKQEVASIKLLEIAYYVLFYGVGPNSSRMLKISLNQFDKPFINELEEYLNFKNTKEKAKEEKNLKYIPFEGHQSRLGHY